MPHLHPFSASSNSAVTPTNMKAKETDRDGDVVDKAHPFSRFYVNSVIVGETLPIEKTQKIKRIQPI